MRNIVPDLIILLIILITFALAHIVSYFLFEYLNTSDIGKQSLVELVNSKDESVSWLLRLTLNCFGYACVFTPLFLIHTYTNRIKYIERSENGSWLPKIIRICFSGDRTDRTIKSEPSSSTQDFKLFCLCFFGLMISYLLWGVLQEKIMTQDYIGPEDIKSRFTDSQFLVFVNRTLALVISVIYLCLSDNLKHPAPLFKFSYAAFSNIMSAYCQYEALKYVNFPTQVLTKSVKIIFVMIMGKIISKTKYEFHEYLTAGLISVGMILFLTGSADESKHSPSTTVTGLFLLLLYLLFDSFTSNWQDHLSKNYSISSMQMMAGVNTFSSLFTATSIFFQGGFLVSINFAFNHPKFLYDCLILSVCAVTGQLFIYYTILKFGPVAFTIIMTLRQAVAILLSWLIYQHKISTFGFFGIVIVFLAIFIRFYGNHRIRQIRKRTESNKGSFKTRIEV